MPAIPSPCVARCGLDPVSGWCVGCARTIDEIARWASTTAADRAAVMAALPARQAKLAEAQPSAGSAAGISASSIAPARR